MTRETKIGLLVGLAFIIVVGILLSDNMNAAREPAPAPLQIAGNSVRSGLGQPVSDADPADAGPAPSPLIVAPKEPVPTQDELNPKPKPAAVAATIPPTAPIELTNKHTATPTDAIANTAQQAGEQLVDADGNAITPAQTTGSAAASDDSADNNTPTSVTKPITLATRTYKAQPGDTLGKIAQKLLGSGNKTNRAAIIALNTSLKADPNKIIVGHTYTIPAAPSQAVAPLAPTKTDAPTTPTKVAVASTDDSTETKTPEKKTPAGPTHIYTVKSGDTLWSIAVNQLGDASTMDAIKDLNPKLNPNRLHPNMKIILPAKPVADAQ